MKKIVLAALAASVALCAQANASTVFQSIPDLSVAPTVNAYCSSCSGSFRVYDNFSLASATALNSVTAALDSDYVFPTDVTVGIFSGTATNVGTAIWSQTFAPSAYLSMQDTGHGTSLVSFDLTGLNLDAGSYVISFYNPQNLGVPTYAQGALSAAQDGGALGQTTAFSLDGDAAAVPEPASWAMMVGGFGLMGATMRRKKATVSFA